MSYKGLKFAGMTMALLLSTLFIQAQNAESSTEARLAPSGTQAVSTASGAVSQAEEVVMHPNAPAPPISQIIINYVCYSNDTICYNVYNQLSISGHGPTYSVVIFTIGYGYTPVVTIGGAQLPTSAEISNTPVCDNGSGVGPCSAGQTVVGFRTEWLTGGRTGRFFFSQQSINGGSTKTASINLLD